MAPLSLVPNDLDKLKSLHWQLIPMTPCAIVSQDFPVYLCKESDKLLVHKWPCMTLWLHVYPCGTLTYFLYTRWNTLTSQHMTLTDWLTYLFHKIFLHTPGDIDTLLVNMWHHLRMRDYTVALKIITFIYKNILLNYYISFKICVVYTNSLWELPKLLSVFRPRTPIFQYLQYCFHGTALSKNVWPAVAGH